MVSVFLSVLFVLLAAVPAGSAELGPRVLSALSDRSTAAIPVIITLKADPDAPRVTPLSAEIRSRKGELRRLARMRYLKGLRQRSAAHRARLEAFLARRSIHNTKSLWHINSLAAELPPDLVSELTARPDVLSIRYDNPVSPPPSPTPAPLAVVPADNLTQIQVPELWAMGLTGQNVTVAVMDTGVDSMHPDLQPGYRGGDNSWFNAIAATECPVGGINGCDFCDTDTSQPCDSDGHGTAVAGILVGGSGSGQAIGVAPDARWIAAKIFKSDGSGTPSSTISQAFAWLLDPDGNPATDDAPDILNASWGFDPGDGCLSLFESDIQALRDAGIAVVFSAGNSGPNPGTDVSPANYANSYAVGAVGDFGSTTNVSTFSSRGPSTCDGAVFPDVVAPGYEILTTAGLGGYVLVSGTSFATPHVSGIMALLRGQGGFLGATVSELEDALRLSAIDLGAPGPDNDYGYGLVDARAAYELLLAPAATPVTPGDGSTLAGPDVTLSWRQPLDSLGAQVSNTVLLDTDPNFSNPASYPVASTGQAPGAAGYAMFGLAAMLLPVGRRKKRRARLLLIFALLLPVFLGACGGGGSSAPATDPALRSLQVAGLAPGATYYWKVTSRTPRGGPQTESDVWSFTVRP